MHKFTLARFLTLFIPIKKVRQRTRNRLENYFTRQKRRKTATDRIENELAYIKRFLQLNHPKIQVPRAQGVLRAAQLMMLDRLNTIVHLLDENEINYWLDFGTLLGAVLHKGFIPWDEDIDISIKLSDKERLIHLLEANNIEFSFIEGKNSLMKVPVLKLSRYVIHVDIMAYAEAKCTNAEGRKLIDAYLTEKNKDTSSYYTEGYHTQVSGYIKKVSDLNQGTEVFYVRCVDVKLQYPTYAVPENEIFPLSTLEFEGRNFKVPKCYITYLSNMYKDFMLWPDTLVTNSIHDKTSPEQRAEMWHYLRDDLQTIP